MTILLKRTAATLSLSRLESDHACELRSMFQAIGALAGMVLAGCFFLPLIAPSQVSTAWVCWRALVGACQDSPLGTDATVYLVLGMVMPYLIGLLLAIDSLARCGGNDRVASICRFSQRALLVVVGAGVLWALPDLYYANHTNQNCPGLFSSGLALASLLLWPQRSEQSQRNLCMGLVLSFGCLTWFSFLLITIPVEMSGMLGAVCSAILSTTHAFEMWPIRLSAAPADQVVLASGPAVAAIH